jgi:hypothetical protein
MEARLRLARKLGRDVVGRGWVGESLLPLWGVAVFEQSRRDPLKQETGNCRSNLAMWRCGAVAFARFNFRTSTGQSTSISIPGPRFATISTSKLSSMPNDRFMLVIGLSPIPLLYCTGCDNTGSDCRRPRNVPLFHIQPSARLCCPTLLHPSLTALTPSGHHRRRATRVARSRLQRPAVVPPTSAR